MWSYLLVHRTWFRFGRHFLFNINNSFVFLDLRNTFLIVNGHCNSFLSLKRNPSVNPLFMKIFVPVKTSLLQDFLTIRVVKSSKPFYLTISKLYLIVSWWTQTWSGRWLLLLAASLGVLSFVITLENRMEDDEVVSLVAFEVTKSISYKTPHNMSKSKCVKLVVLTFVNSTKLACFHHVKTGFHLIICNFRFSTTE